VTGAAGQIGYSLVFRIARGDLLGPDQPVVLSMLEITPALGALNGVVMELMDCAFPLLHGVETSDDASRAFEGVNYALLVGSRPRTKGMERKDLLEANGAIFTVQGKAHLEAHGFEIANFANLQGIDNIYDTTAEQAYRLARLVDADEAEAVFLSGTGMPTVTVLEMLEQDLGKPVISSASAMMWHALRLAGVGQPISGYGRLLTLK